METVKSKVWKVGSRWSTEGLRNTSILSIFRRNNVVFVGSSDEVRSRFMKEVHKGDYLAIADGRQIVAIAKAVSEPSLLKDLKRIETTADDFEFEYESEKDWVVGVKVNIVEINKDDFPVFYYWKMGTFFSLNKDLGTKVIKYYNQQSTKFSINSYTATLMNSGDKKYKSLLDTNTKYIIPVYQRPYEWSEDQIIPFITDIVNAYLGEEQTAQNSEPMFIGTMQLSQKKYISRTEYEQDVIDGQQRLTTLTILLFELQKIYSNCKALETLKFNWIKNHINTQQSAYVQSYFSHGEELPLNKYYTNSHIIRETFESSFPQDFELDINQFCDFIFHSIYFVVIETAAGLSKTIQIFNTINNTGLDLNGGDLFKVRMYEYLTDYESADESAFDQINALYQRIDEKNKELGRSVTEISDILDIYKNILITKYDLPTELFAYGWETFYNRLFDTLLGIKDWGASFRAAIKNKLVLSLDEIDKVITIRYAKDQYEYKNIETKFASRHTSWSRYSRSKNLMIYVFLFFHWSEDNKFDQLEKLIIEMNKLFFAYSVVYYKQVSEINTFVANAVQDVKKDNSEATIIRFREKITKLNQNWLKNNLEGYINDNAKRKNLICALSTFLTEREICPQNVIEHIFKTPFDIEHIHANADEAIQLEDNLQNSIGNLTQLEQSINRSIQDQPFAEKRKAYPKSCYIALRNIAKLEQWNTSEAEERRQNEVKNMMLYLFNH